MDAGGKNLIHDYEENRTGGQSFSGHGVWCVDGEDLLHFWFDTYGFAPLTPARGGWVGNELVVSKETPRGQGRSIWMRDEKALRYLVEARPSGQDTFLQVMSGSYDRVVGF